MKIKFGNILFFVLWISLSLMAEAQSLYNNPVIDLDGPDPTIIKRGNYFYLYHTGGYVPIYRSENLVSWERIGAAFSNESHPTFVENGGVWAPDINYIKGRYVMYYSMSTWGGVWTAGIGVAVSHSPSGGFSDRGKLFDSTEIDVKNSIDPFYYEEEDGTKYLFWGSFNGIFAIELSDDGLSIKEGAEKKQIAGTLTEGTYIYKRDGYYYLFGSAGSCCEGLKSTYHMVVARSKNLLGPYVDKKGNSSLSNNFSELLQASDETKGPGHCSEIVEDDKGKTWILYHGYQVANPEAGRCVYLDQIMWDNDGWPYIVGSKPSNSWFKPVLGKREYTGDDFYPVHELPFTSVKLNDNLWNPRIRLNNEVSVPDFIDKCYHHGRIDNFKKAAGMMSGYFNTSFTFDDADVYKCIEALANYYMTNPEPELENKMDELIRYVVSAQEEDGYILTAWTARNPNAIHPWLGKTKFETEPQNSHETFTLGHLYDASIAHYYATGKRTLLDVAIKNADLLVDYYLNKGSNHEPGHELIEMALIKLFLVTKNEEYIKLSRYLMDLRGRGVMHHDYSQDHKPVTEQSEAVGHAVRAAYLYCAMTDIAAFMHDQDYLNAVNRIWENVVSKKLYITGGIGSKGANEGFSTNYDLPNVSAYCESCAAIANVFWNWRLFKFYEDSKYIDILERSLYNNVLSSTGLDGTTYFYPNRLESDGDVERSPWFDCACCPSSICRFIATIPSYFYAYKNDSVFVNLFAQGVADIPIGKKTVTIRQVTNYPWGGKVELIIDKSVDTPFNLMIRIPGWTKNQPVPSSLYTYNSSNNQSVTVELNGEIIDVTVSDKGYVCIKRTWNVDDVVVVDFPMEVKRVKAHASVAENAGKLAYERGPIVYCAEEWDNMGQLSACSASSSAEDDIEEDDILNGIVRVNVHGKKIAYNSTTGKAQRQDTYIRMIPYYAWNNRGKAAMKTWIPIVGKTDQITMGDVVDTDTLMYKVNLPAGNGTITIQLPRIQIAQYLNLTIGQLGKEFGNTISFDAVEPNHNVYQKNTLSTYGHWFDKKGYVSTTTGQNLVYSEFSPSSYTLSIGQAPSAAEEHTNVVVQQALTYFPPSFDSGEKIRRVLLKIDITIGESTKIDQRNCEKSRFGKITPDPVDKKG